MHRQSNLSDTRGPLLRVPSVPFNPPVRPRQMSQPMLNREEEDISSDHKTMTSEDSHFSHPCPVRTRYKTKCVKHSINFRIFHVNYFLDLFHLFGVNIPANRGKFVLCTKSIRNEFVNLAKLI